MVSLHRKRRRVSKSHMARGGNLTTLNRERRVAKIAKVANARRVLAESAAKSAKADAAAAVVATACSEESIDLTALAAVNALIECSRPHLPYTSLAVAFTGRASYAPPVGGVWERNRGATEALTLFAIHRGGGRATLVEHVAKLAEAAHLAVATRDHRGGARGLPDHRGGARARRRGRERRREPTQEASQGRQSLTWALI